MQTLINRNFMHLKLSCIPEVMTDAGFHWSLSRPQLCYLINSELTSWNGSLHRYHLLVSIPGLLKQALPAFQMDPVSIFLLELNGRSFQSKAAQRTLAAFPLHRCLAFAGSELFSPLLEDLRRVAEYSGKLLSQEISSVLKLQTHQSGLCCCQV